jgi:hypothetical protein
MLNNGVYYNNCNHYNYAEYVFCKTKLERIDIGNTHEVFLPIIFLHMKLICLLIFICIFGGILSSLLVLLYLALERYICIIHPLFHSRIKLCHVALFSLLAHSIGIIYAVIPFVLKNNWKEYLVCVANVYPLIMAVTEEFRETGMYRIWVNIHLKFSFKFGFDSSLNTINNWIQHTTETPDIRNTVTNAFPFNRNGVYWMLEINKMVTSLILILFL